MGAETDLSSPSLDPGTLGNEDQKCKQTCGKAGPLSTRNYCSVGRQMFQSMMCMLSATGKQHSYVEYVGSKYGLALTQHAKLTTRWLGLQIPEQKHDHLTSVLAVTLAESCVLAVGMSNVILQAICAFWF
ncbi:hypothetical protein ACQJBY_043060 [Aegilops geniculata]